MSEAEDASAAVAAAPPQPSLFLDALPYLDTADAATQEQVQALLQEGQHKQTARRRGQQSRRNTALVGVIVARSSLTRSASLSHFALSLSWLLQRCRVSRALPMNICRSSFRCEAISKNISNTYEASERASASTNEPASERTTHGNAEGEHTNRRTQTAHARNGLAA